MATLDIREEEEITEIRFDSTSDRVTHKGDAIVLIDINDSKQQILLCNKANLDNLIKALQRAKKTMVLK